MPILFHERSWHIETWCDEGVTRANLLRNVKFAAIVKSVLDRGLGAARELIQHLLGIIPAHIRGDAVELIVGEI